MPIRTTATLALVSSLCLAACAGPGDRRPERPAPSPERMAEMQERFLARWDHDSDGAVTCDDVAFERAELFYILDTNEDEELASSEYRYAKFEDKSFLFHLFSDVDTDQSGAISSQELSDVSHSQFAALDRDGDCLVSPEEAMIAMRERAREERSSERESRGEKGGRGRGGQRPNGQRPGGLTDTDAS